MIRLVTAAEVPPANVVAFADGGVGVVVERGEALPGSLDQTPSVRALVLRPGLGGAERGRVAVMSGTELVVNLGALEVSDLTPWELVRVTNNHAE